MHSRPTLEEMGRIDLPILIIRGEHSQVLPEDAGERFQRMLRNGSLREVANCGHNVHSQNTQGFLDVLDPFVDALI